MIWRPGNSGSPLFKSVIFCHDFSEGLGTAAYGTQGKGTGAQGDMTACLAYPGLGALFTKNVIGFKVLYELAEAVIMLLLVIFREETAKIFDALVERAIKFEIGLL
jgi:hypothetical protein